MSLKKLWMLGLVMVFAVALAACNGGSEEETEGEEGADGSGGEESAEETGWAPEEDIEMIAPAGAGGGWDTLARTIQNTLDQTDMMDVAMGVENMPGAGGAIGWNHVHNQSGNPHTLFVASPPLILVPMSGETDLSHDDFTPLARMITDYMVMAVNADSEYENVEDIVNALDEGENLSIAGGSAPGSMDHIATAAALMEAGADSESINYTNFEGGGEAVTQVVGGHADIVASGMGEVQEQVNAGNLRIVGVSAPEGTELPMEAETYQDQGIDYTFDIWRGVLGPPDMPEESIAYYEQLFEDLMDTEEWQEQQDNQGWIAAYQNSEEFGTFLDEQREEFETVLENLDY